MKLNVPFRTKQEVVPLIDAGADELYCGYLSGQWRKRFTSLEFERKGGESNFTDVDELRQAVELAHRRGVPVSLAINGLYVKNQYDLLLTIVRSLARVDLDAFIVADLGLLLTLRKMGFKKKIHISTGGTVFNTEACRFYKELGAARIILDRQMSLGSMRALARGHPDMEFEAFILNTLCVYIDGFCTFMHSYGSGSVEDIPIKKSSKQVPMKLLSVYDLRSRLDACCFTYSIQAYDVRLKKTVGLDRARPGFFKQQVDAVECGACALYDLKNAGVMSLKIVGRQYSPEKRLADTKFIRSALHMLGRNTRISKENFARRVRALYRKTYDYKSPCRGNNCYYPQAGRGYA